MDTQQQANADALAAVCVDCEHKRSGLLFCEKLQARIDQALLDGFPFCPLGKHDGVAPVTAGLFPGFDGRAKSIAIKQAKPVPQSGWCRFRDRLAGYVVAPLKLCLVAVRAYRPADKIVTRRRVICLGDDKGTSPCEHRHRLAGVVERCRACGCSITAKTALAPEACPKMKWTSVRTEDCGCGG